MALRTELYGLKSAGVYRFEKDQSVIQTSAEPLNNIRMLVGFSKQGVFNTPVFIRDTKEFTNIFGDIDRSLEKKGSFFHRSCIAALSAGPIYALNLLKLDDTDEVDSITFSTSPNCVNVTNKIKYNNLYNIDTFYTPSEESYLKNLNSNLSFSNELEENENYNNNNIINFSNIGKSPISVIVTKSNNYNSTNYNITANEWYGKGNVPSFLNETSLISDFMIDVYVIKGAWGGIGEENKFERFASDVKFNKYFNKDYGVIRKKNSNDTTDTLFNQFLNEPDVQLIGKYTGSLIPNFIDKNGHNIYIEYLINSDINVNGLLCAVNQNIFDDELIDGAKCGIDLIGHSLYDQMVKRNLNDINFLSYNYNKNVITKDIEVSIKNNTDLDNTDYKDNITDLEELYNRFNNGELIYQKNESTLIPVKSIEKDNDNNYKITNVKNEVLSDVDGFLSLHISKGLINDNKIYFIEGTEIYKNITSLGDADYIKDNDIDINWTTENISNTSSITNVITYNFDENYKLKAVVANLPENTQLNNDTYKICLQGNNLNTTITVEKTNNGNEFIIPNTNDDVYSNVKVGNYVLSKNNDNTHRLTKIISIKSYKSNDEQQIQKRLITCQDRIEFFNTNNTITVEVYKNFTDTFECYNIFTLNGFKLKEKHLPNGTNERQSEILDLLTEDGGNLYNALTDRELIQFRYVVDTFGLGIEEECKSQYTKLCQGRKSSFAIINMPSMNDFSNSVSPSFTDKNNAVSAEFIAKGGDPNKNPDFLFSLPSKINGATWGAYYYPYLKVYSNYTTISVPPAAYVSNNYVAKYGAGSPWTLVAGQNRGVISGNNVVGVESSLIRDNRDWLEPAGVNSIIYQNGIGCVIYANKTALQTPKSALSSINCREACIYIQDGIENILRNYLFETNTAQTRLEIKTLVDNFLSTVKQNGGIYDFHTTMDSSNNTSEVIDHNMAVIDIYIEPVRGLEIITQTLTILKTGAIESGTLE